MLQQRETIAGLLRYLDATIASVKRMGAGPEDMARLNAKRAKCAEGLAEVDATIKAAADQLIKRN